MTEPLRPMSTGQLLDHTFTLYRKHFLLFVGIATVGPAANMIFQLLTVGSNIGTPFRPRGGATGPAVFAQLGLSMFFGYIIMLAGMALSHAATVKAVTAVYLGHGITIAGAYKALRGRILSLFGTFGLILLWVALAVIGIAVVAIPVFIGIAATGRSSPGPMRAIASGLAVIVIAFSIFAVIAVYIRYALAIQACVIENLGPSDSLSRSVILTKGSRRRVVVIYVIFMLLNMILAAGLAGIAGAFGAMLHNRIAAAVLVYLAGFVAGSLTGPLATIGLSLLYYDERVRKEAFDLQLMLSTLDIPPVTMELPAQA